MSNINPMIFTGRYTALVFNINKGISRGCSQHDEAMTLECLGDSLQRQYHLPIFHTTFTRRRAAAAVVSHNGLVVVRLCVGQVGVWSVWRVSLTGKLMNHLNGLHSSEHFMALGAEKVLDHYSAMSSTPTSCSTAACVAHICVCTSPSPYSKRNVQQLHHSCIT